MVNRAEFFDGLPCRGNWMDEMGPLPLVFVDENLQAWVLETPVTEFARHVSLSQPIIDAKAASGFLVARQPVYTCAHFG